MLLSLVTGVSSDRMTGLDSRQQRKKKRKQNKRNKKRETGEEDVDRVERNIQKHVDNVTTVDRAPFSPSFGLAKVYIYTFVCRTP